MGTKMKGEGQGLRKRLHGVPHTCCQSKSKGSGVIPVELKWQELVTYLLSAFNHRQCFSH